jgi:phosphoribosyl-ATP pyrophosphohydrolase/phosphoribosyl-AMP cyclohydrolase/histidinol dehydrogenase
MVYPALLPLLNKPVAQVDADLLAACIRVGPVLVLAEHSDVIADLPPTAEYYIDVGHDASQAAQYLAQGASKVVIDSDTDLPEDVSRQSVILRTTADQAQGRPTHHKFGGLILTGSDNIDAATIKHIRDNLLESPGLIFSESGASTSPEMPKVVALSKLSRESLAFAFTSTLTSDRPDKLFATVVCAANGASALPLGLVYSSVESVSESIITGRGVYQSRKHGLWRKGETSGSTQKVVRIRKDCDNDALLFEVEQSGTGFCHLETEGCFSDVTSTAEKKGIAALEETLKSRLASAPEGSYTARLFNDDKLLQQKIMEEAEELVEAKDDDARHVAFEAADLLYFTMVRCIKAGVSWADVERSLDEKAAKGKKGERRQGDAKQKWVEKLADKQDGTSEEKLPGQAKESTTDAPVPKSFPTEPNAEDADAPIRMRTSSLDSCSADEKAALLKRPVMDSSAMIERVKPIVNKVRDEGDAAVRSFTQQFDRLHVQLESNIMRAPFYTPESVPEDVLPKKVRDAIDSAYANLKAFHVGQAETKPLVVETMPGVVCTRFARPIDRVGIYVPGGTAILPSTALHLGVPAQVAGCTTIVLATPPRQDGSISPEVLYVAQLVGVSCILKAGGAQAVAAMAYGTEECPKVDKIFGPGNQWVTAAKMLVQNDTHALVGIDMPAGPSEVMVCKSLESPLAGF